MSLSVWVGVFLISSLFWVWLLFWGGADWLEGSWLAAVFIHYGAMEMTADGIKMFAAMTWLVECVWFMIGLFVPEARMFLH